FSRSTVLIFPSSNGYLLPSRCFQARDDENDDNKGSDEIATHLQVFFKPNYHTIYLELNGEVYRCLNLFDSVERCIQMRRRLFNGILIGRLYIDIDDGLMTESVMKTVFDNCIIKSFSIKIGSEHLLESALQIIKDVPANECSMSLMFFPEITTLLALPTMRSLRLFSTNEDNWHISYDLIVKLM
ncbi:hypothetical protein PMAYCL1PPCAC_22314, partial [Pristionchus mayeri]